METPRQKFDRFMKLADNFASELQKKDGDFFKAQMGLQALDEELTRFRLFENKNDEMLFEFNELEMLIVKMSSIAVSKTWIV